MFTSRSVCGVTNVDSKIKANIDPALGSNPQFKPHFFHPIMKLAHTLILLGSLLTVSSLHAKWGRIPIMQEKPVNVAVKGTHTGTVIDSSSGVGQVDNLINQADVTLAATFGAGKSFFIIGFGKPLMISTSSFANDGIEGKVSLSASADKNGWAVLEEKVITAADRDVQFKFAGIQAKFLKFEFLLSKGGSARALSIMGGTTDRSYALKQDPSGQKGQPMNFIGGLGGARLVYAAPKPVNGIDSAATFNKFEFPESDEKYRTLIYDMGQIRIMSEFSSVHSPSPVRFEVFAFDKLPEKEDWRGRLAFDPADFNVAKPVVAYEDKLGTGHIKVKPNQPVKTRYLALRWEPDFNPPAFLIDSVGSTGNVFNITGPQTTTATINGQQVKVTVDPGNAPGAGAGGATVTVQTLDSTGAVVSSVTYQNVVGAQVTPTGVQVYSGGDPGTLAAVVSGGTGGTGTIPVVQVTPTTGGALNTTPTDAGTTLGITGGTVNAGATQTVPVADATAPGGAPPGGGGGGAPIPGGGGGGGSGDLSGGSGGANGSGVPGAGTGGGIINGGNSGGNTGGTGSSSASP